jgi:hypothetical protein
MMQASVHSSISTKADSATAFRRNRLTIHSHKALKLLAVALCVTGLATGAYAEKPENPGNPGNGSGGKPENPGGGGGKPDKPGRGKGDAYADLVVLYRDAKGAPILDDNGCLQPISASPVAGLGVVTNEADGKSVSLITLGGTGAEGEECDVNPEPDNLALVQEVLFGRLNLGRAPTKVLAQQLREVTSNLASSSSPIEIDEAGRLVYYSGEAGIEVDSPGNNLAIHKELQVGGALVDQTQTPIVLPPQANDADGTGFLDHAAAALGAAAGKGDLINLDLVVYDNRILNIPSSTTVLDTVTRDGVKYVDYDSSGYSYERSSVFPGCVRGLLVDFPSTGLTTSFSGTIMNCVFGSIDASGMCSGGQNFIGHTALHGFAQRADDARAVIAFVHDNVVADSTAILDPAFAGVDQAGQNAVCGEI